MQPSPWIRRVEVLGDSAWLVRVASRIDAEGLRSARAVASALGRSPPTGVTDLVAAYGTVAVLFDPDRVSRATVAAWVGETLVAHEAARTGPRDATCASATNTDGGTLHAIPVHHGGEFGPDLDHVAERAGLSATDVIERHSAGRYTVAAIGFTPGFAYLAGLAPELATPRRATPRLKVAAGSVAIGGAQTGVYPIESPGGWNVIGRTPLRLFDVERTNAALLRGGDTVRFEPIGARAFARRIRTLPSPAASRSAPPASGAARVRAPVAAFEVILPGAQSSLQDRGRVGHAAQGIAPGGALDPLALAVCNRLVGNRPDAAALECALTGPRLRVLRPVKVAVAGAHVAGLPCGRPLQLEAGSELDLRALERGARAYLSVAGGFAAPVVLGSRSTELRAGFGGLAGRALVAGDRLAVEDPAPLRTVGSPPTAVPPWRIDSALLHDRPRFAPLRVLRGPQADWFHSDAWASFLARAWTLTPRSDRMGLRLSGPALPLRAEGLPEIPAAPRELWSEGVTSGTIQLPPDGRPIVLLADRPTIGGYPKLAVVIRADLGRAAQLRPGETVRFEEVSLAAADAAAQAQQGELARLDVALRLRGVEAPRR
jgi:KipI family sensor histidine kinase inhibitor